MAGTAECLANRLIGASPAIRLLREDVQRVAQADDPVLIQGETGSGKEIVSQLIHELSGRGPHRLLAVNCAALPASLLESELFGHVRGAFTGATRNRDGLFVRAHGGTLFLDEIGEMPLRLQPRLLRVLENGEVRPLGADETRRVNVRVIAATHRDLGALVNKQRFRSDLYYRINVLGVQVPPLRDRAEDIPLLVSYFVRRVGDPARRGIRLSPEVAALFQRYPWPGNVRELENVLRRLLAFCAGDTIAAADVRRYAPALLEAAEPLELARRRLPSLRELTDEYVEWVLDHCHGNKRRAAGILGIDVSTLYRRARRRPPRK